MEDGLPHNIVQAITQTRDGYLWVGTREGLARFDGVRFTPVALTAGSSGFSINALRETQDGSLWVGTENAGLFQMKPGKVTRYTEADGLPSDSVRAIEEGTDGTIWILSAKGLVHLRGGRITRPDDKRLSDAVATAIHRGRNGSMWVASNLGLTEFREQGTTQYTQATGLPVALVRTIYDARNGDVWLGLERGVIRIRNGVLASYPRASGPTANVNAIGEDRRGALWIGTYSGLEQLLGESFVAEEATGKGSLKIYTIFADREQNLWVGSEEGLQRFSPKRFTSYTRHEGLTHDRTMSVCGGPDGSIWIGTWGGGVNRLKDGKLTAYTKANGLASDLVSSILVGRDGSIWAGVSAPPWGLQRLKDGQWTHFGNDQGLHAGVMVIHEDRQEILWTGGTTGVMYRLANEQWVPCPTEDGLPNAGICALCDRREGGVWMGTEAGLAYWGGDRFTRLTVSGKPFQDHVLSLYEEADGTLWIGTKGKGLTRFKHGKLDTFTVREGLGSDVIYAILEDDRGNLWMSGSRGIFRVRKAELEQLAAGEIPSVKSVGYGKADGIVSSSQYSGAVQPAGTKGTDGRLWFRTTQGVVVTDPNQIMDNRLPPPVAIEEALADKQPVMGGPSSASILGGLARSAINIPPGSKELEFRYTALSLQAAEQNRFKYRLEGADSDWTDAGARRFASYHNLAPGSYQFQVQASNNDGVWNETGASLAFVVQAYYWQTRWFRGLVLALVVGGIAWIVRRVTSARLRRRLELAERQHALERERARIAQDLHDDLGASLTQINFLGALAAKENAEPAQVKEDIGRIRAKAREMVGALDEIVWAVNPKNDSLAELAHYLCHSAEEFFRGSAIRCRLDVAASLPAKTLTTEARHNLFLAVREALNNAAKHSGASEVWLRIGTQGDVVTVVVEDDGRGLRESATSAVGDGLANMRARLASLGGQAEIQSEPGKGTRVTLTVPLP